jgi:PilZ domain
MRNSKAASPPKIPSDTENAAGLATALAGADDLIDLAEELNAALEKQEAASEPDTLDETDHRTLTDDEFTAALEKEKPAGPSVAQTGADRRTHPRYEFTAAVEIIAAESGMRIETRVRDLSKQGCYVDTNEPLPLGTVTNVRITKGAQSFEAPARVVFTRAGKGMGLVFTAIQPEQHRTIGKWLAESRETSWLAANRRKSQRVLMAIPVRVSGETDAGSPFEEETHTRSISAHGALILMSNQVYRGQRLTLSNVQTKAALECVVAHINRGQGEHSQAGVEFTLPNPMFWHVAFPPKDWTPRHPDAKSRLKTGESS